MRLSISAGIIVIFVWALMSGLVRPSRAWEHQGRRVNDLVVVSEESQVDSGVSGCDGSWVLSVDAQQPLFHATDERPETARFGSASLTGLRLVLSLESSWSPHEGYAPYIARMRMDGSGEWQNLPPLTGGRFGGGPGIAVMPDDDSLLVDEYPPDGGPEEPGAGLAKYCLSEVLHDGTLGPRRGYFSEASTPNRILPSADGRTAQVINARFHMLYTIDVVSMASVAPPVFLNVTGPGTPEDVGPSHELPADISQDEDHILVMTYEDALGVVGLDERRFWTVPLGAGCNDGHRNMACGELALNHAPVNTGLLAVNARDAVVVYRVAPDWRSVERLARYPLTPSAAIGPPQIAWSGDGTRIIAESSQTDGSVALVLSVTGGGTGLEYAGRVHLCNARGSTSIAGDILTSNRVVEPRDSVPQCAPPSPTSSPLPARTPTRTATGAPTPTDAASETPGPPTASAIPTHRATANPRPVYLPLTVYEACDRETTSADVALVLDTSSSMWESTPSGMSKLHAARTAAGYFVRQLGPKDQASIVWFNATSGVAQQLTNDTGALLVALNGLTVSQYTRIDLGIERARGELSSRRRIESNEAVLILLTDGKSDPLGPEAAMREADFAKASGVIVFTVGLGTTDNLDDGALRVIASRPEYYYQTPDASDLTGIYAKIARVIPCATER